MIKCENGVYVEMTPEEIEEYNKLQLIPQKQTIEEQIIALQNALITSKIVGGGIKVTDSSNLPVEVFSMSGRTEQIQTTGAQLFTIKRKINVGDTGINQAGWTKDNISEDAYSILNNYQTIIFTVDDEDTNSFTIETEAVESANGASLELPVKVDSNTSYTTSASDNISMLEFKEKDENLAGTGSSNVVNKKAYTFTTKETTAWVILRFRAVVKTKVKVRNFQIQKGSAVTAYEPYTGGKPSPSPDFPQSIEVTSQGIITVDFTDGANHQTVALNCPREFTKWDKLEKIDGVWNWVFQSRMDTDIKPSRADLFVVDPILYKSYENGLYCYTWEIIKKSIGWQTSLCTQFKNIDNSYGKGEKAWTYSDQPSLRSQYFVTAHKTVDEFKEWVEANPLTMWYKTEISEHVPLPQPEQDKLNALTMYSPNTEITNTGGCNMELTYTVDTKSYVDSKIAALSKAML